MVALCCCRSSVAEDRLFEFAVGLSVFQIGVFRRLVKQFVAQANLPSYESTPSFIRVLAAVTTVRRIIGSLRASLARSL